MIRVRFATKRALLWAEIRDAVDMLCEARRGTYAPRANGFDDDVDAMYAQEDRGEHLDMLIDGCLARGFPLPPEVISLDFYPW